MRHERPRWFRIARVRARRLISRADRSAPLWLSWIPSWGTSLLVHAVALVILATVVFIGGSRPQAHIDFDTSIISLADDPLDSLVPAPRSGDPFTEAQSNLAPSLSLQPSDRELRQPDLSGASFGPRLSMPDRSASDRGSGASELSRAIRTHVEDITAPFSGRMGPGKAQLIRREGGSPASEKAVQDGLNWLMRHQRPDGGWSLDVSGQCKTSPGCLDEVHAVSDTAATGLALLAFQGAGHIHTEPSRYQEQVRRGLDWLIAHQQQTGEIYLGGLFNAALYSHAIATMALCEAYGISKDVRLKEPAQLGIFYIVQSQNKEDGGWRYSPGMAGDTSVFGWQMFALRSAKLAGLEVPRNVLRGCRHYLDEAGADKNRTTYSYLPGREPSAVMSAEGLLCRQYLGWPKDHPALVKGVAGVWSDLQARDERNIYYWYYATQLLHNMQNRAWRTWNGRIRDGLVSMQLQGSGCDQGSWSPTEPRDDRWGKVGGRLFQTSLSILTLEVYYRFLPLYRTGDEPVKPEADPKP